MKERSVEKQVCDWAKENGISTLKLGGIHNRGKADRLFMKGGKTIFCELKAPGKKPTDLQFKFIRERRADGFAADWFDNAGFAIRFLSKEFNV